jgi:acid phosphatase family membrane protein YuiD
MFAEFAGNRIFFITLYAWLVTQSLKVIIGVIREKRFNFRWFVGTGGMPSSHAATVSALSTAVGLHSGFGSAVFVITLAFSVIVIFEAGGGTE